MERVRIGKDFVNTSLGGHRLFIPAFEQIVRHGEVKSDINKIHSMHI